MEKPGPKWSDRLALDVALVLEDKGSNKGEMLKRVAEENNITLEDFEAYMGDPSFETALNVWRADIKEHGMTFQMKCQAQAEALLPVAWSMVNDPKTGASVRADLIKSVVRWAGLDFNPKAIDTNVGGNQPSIIINMGDKPITVEGGGPRPTLDAIPKNDF